MDSWQAWISLIISSLAALFVWYMKYKQTRKDKEKDAIIKRLRKAEDTLMILEKTLDAYNIKEMMERIIVLESQLAALPKRSSDSDSQ